VLLRALDYQKEISECPRMTTQLTRTRALEEGRRKYAQMKQLELLEQQNLFHPVRADLKGGKYEK